MKLDWKIGLACALGAGTIYAVYRAEKERSAQEELQSGKGLVLRSLSLDATMKPATKPLLGDLTPTQATGTAMIGGFAFYAAGDLVWDLIKAKIVAAA